MWHLKIEQEGKELATVFRFKPTTKVPAPQPAPSPNLPHFPLLLPPLPTLWHQPPHLPLPLLLPPLPILWYQLPHLPHSPAPTPAPAEWPTKTRTLMMDFTGQYCGACPPCYNKNRRVEAGIQRILYSRSTFHPYEYYSPKLTSPMLTYMGCTYPVLALFPAPTSITKK